MQLNEAHSVSAVLTRSPHSNVLFIYIYFDFDFTPVLARITKKIGVISPAPLEKNSKNSSACIALSSQNQPVTLWH